MGLFFVVWFLVFIELVQGVGVSTSVRSYAFMFLGYCNLPLAEEDGGITRA